MSVAQPIFDDVAPWPSQDAPPAPRDHNKPPLEDVIPAEFREALLAERPDFLTKFEDLIGAADRARAEDDATLGRCGDLVKSYRACEKHINDTHTAVKAPYLLGGRLVDAEKNTLIERLADAKRRVEAVGNAFVAKRDAEERAERARIEKEQRDAAEKAAAAEQAREAAEQAALDALANDDLTKREKATALRQAERAEQAAEQAMAQAALAPATPVKAEPIRSDAGATISGKQEWRSEVTDYEVAFIAVADNPKVREAIDKAVAGLVRAGKREIEGCRIWPVAKANFR